MSDLKVSNEQINFKIKKAIKMEWFFMGASFGFITTLLLFLAIKFLT